MPVSNETKGRHIELTYYFIWLRIANTFILRRRFCRKIWSAKLTIGGTAMEKLREIHKFPTGDETHEIPEFQAVLWGTRSMLRSRNF